MTHRARPQRHTRASASSLAITTSPFPLTRVLTSQLATPATSRALRQGVLASSIVAAAEMWSLPCPVPRRHAPSPRAGRRRCSPGAGADERGKQREDPGLARRRPLGPPPSPPSVGESVAAISTDGAVSTCPGRTRVAGTRSPSAPPGPGTLAPRLPNTPSTPSRSLPSAPSRSLPSTPSRSLPSTPSTRAPRAQSPLPTTPR